MKHSLKGSRCKRALYGAPVHRGSKTCERVKKKLIRNEYMLPVKRFEEKMEEIEWIYDPKTFYYGTLVYTLLNEGFGLAEFVLEHILTYVLGEGWNCDEEFEYERITFVILRTIVNPYKSSKQFPTRYCVFENKFPNNNVVVTLLFAKNFFKETTVRLDPYDNFHRAIADKPFVQNEKYGIVECRYQLTTERWKHPFFKTVFRLMKMKQELFRGIQKYQTSLLFNLLRMVQSLLSKQLYVFSYEGYCIRHGFKQFAPTDWIEDPIIVPNTLLDRNVHDSMHINTVWMWMHFDGKWYRYPVIIALNVDGDKLKVEFEGVHVILQEKTQFDTYNAHHHSEPNLYLYQRIDWSWDKRVKEEGCFMLGIQCATITRWCISTEYPDKLCAPSSEYTDPLHEEPPIGWFRTSFNLPFNLGGQVMYKMFYDLCSKEKDKFTPFDSICIYAVATYLLTSTNMLD